MLKVAILSFTTDHLEESRTKMGKDHGYSDSKADRQGSQIRELEKKLEQAATQIQGLILCFKQHGTNLNIPFLIDHYEKVLKDIQK